MADLVKQLEAKMKAQEYEEVLQTVEALPDNNPIKIIFKTRVFLGQKKFPDAIELANQGIEKLPNQKHVFCQLKGQALTGQENYKESAESYAIAVELMKDKVDQGTLANYGIALSHTDQQEKAIQILEQAIKKDEKTPQALIAQGNLANMYFKTQKFKEALAIYEKTVLIPNNDKVKLASVWNNKGVCELNEKKIEEAKQSFAKALELNPNLHHINQELATLHYNEMIDYSKKRDFTKALPECEEVIKLVNNDSDPRMEETYLCRALCKLELHQQGVAEAYEDVLRINPNNLTALTNLGNFMLRDGKAQKAIEYFEKVVSVSPSFQVYNNLAQAYFSMNSQDVTRQLLYLNKALELNPNSIISVVRRAQLYNAQQKRQEGMKDLKNAEQLSKDPKNLQDLNEKQQSFVKSALAAILELEAFFEREKQQLLESLKSKADTAQLQKIQEEFEKLQKEIDAQNEAELQDFLKGQQEAAQKPKKVSREDLMKKFAQITEDIEASQKKVEVKAEEIKVEQIKEDIKIERIEKKVDELEECIQVVGLDKVAKVKDTYDKWRTEYVEGYNYSKAFYWTFVNYCDAQKIASTGIVNKVSGYAVGTTTKVAVKVTQAVLDFGASVPIFGAIFSAINGAIGAVYKEYEKFQDEQKKNAILKVIMKNQDADDKEAWSMLVANAAQTIAARKRKYFEAERQIQKKGTLDSMIDWVQDKIKRIKDVASGQKVDLYESWGGEEASQDIVILLAFIMKNHEEMVTNTSQPLDITIADIVYLEDGVVSPKFQEMLDMVKKREEIENPKKQTETRDDSCACQLI